PSGEGDLAIAFNLLKEKLQKEGLFAPEHKRPLKPFPEKIAVLTSDTGAAVRDILNILSKRYPVCTVLLCPVAVQGEKAAPNIIDTLERVYARTDVDLIIVGRGGGSIEDLWAFNDESLARKIYQSPVPVISAVGHETDFTICDFVADVRASTPSHAAEIAVPDMSALKTVIREYERKLSESLKNRYKLSKAKYELLISKPVFASPQTYFDNLALKVDSLTDSIKQYANERVYSHEQRFARLMAGLDALSPLKTISRGFAAVSSGDALIKSVSQLSVGQDVSLRFGDGNADCKVTALRSKK
ncbi:MAG: exodeoxyribonuclease VII large subunit, partial [Clostridia bacterium]|nr:exodeoxyribonuclease VII large subunit [Clostridia bacterium]